MTKIQVEKALPYESTWGDADYDVQNMLYRQTHFPAFFHKGDHYNRVWSDALPSGVWSAAVAPLVSKYNLSFIGLLQGCSPDEFLTFMKALSGTIPADWNVVGARLVRYTNKQTLYPVYAIDIFAKGKETPDIPLYSGFNAPNVKRPKHEEDIDMRFMSTPEMAYRMFRNRRED
jgi:hypothetical protein